MLIDNVVLVSGIQQSESVTHTSTLFQTLPKEAITDY